MTQPDHQSHHTDNDPHHGHGHHEGQLDWSVRGPELDRGAEVTAPMVDQALAWLAQRVPDARDVVDVGSGPGVAACAFARVLPRARVLAADGAAPLLAMVRQRADRLGVADRVTTREVALPGGLADLPPADLVWVSGVVHHLPDPVATLRALGALVRPGGLLAVREGGLPMRFLPDGVAAGLMARMEAVGEELVESGEHPAGIVAHRGGWPQLLASAGLRPAGSRSFLLDLPAPVSPPAREYLRGRLETLHGFLGDRMDNPADAAAVAKLLDDADPESIARHPGLFLLTASTVHTAEPIGPARGE